MKHISVKDAYPIQHMSAPIGWRWRCGLHLSEDTTTESACIFGATQSPCPASRPAAPQEPGRRTRNPSFSAIARQLTVADVGRKAGPRRQGSIRVPRNVCTPRCHSCSEGAGCRVDQCAAELTGVEQCLVGRKGTVVARFRRPVLAANYGRLLWSRASMQPADENVASSHLTTS